MSDEIMQVAADELDESENEFWHRRRGDLLLGVDAVKVNDVGDEWQWSVGVSVAEFVRDEPLVTELCDGIMLALRSVPGVTAVVHEDREVWIVNGEPAGPDLVRAAAQVVDGLAERVQVLRDQVR